MSEEEQHKGAAAPGLSEEEKAYILDLLADGRGSSEIAQLTERDPRTINKFIRKSGANVEVRKVDEKGKQDLLNLSYVKFRHLVQSCNDGHSFRSLIDAFKTLTEVDRALKFDETGERNPNRGPSMVLNFNVQGKADLNMDIEDPDSKIVEGEARKVTGSEVEAEDDDFALLEQELRGD